MTSSYSTDIVIFGGGIAGLWLLNRLRGEGYDAVLLESEEIGAGQTLASQGIIHGGLKYALNGALNGASNIIADMPARWRSCLAGQGEIDLSGTRVLNEHYYMWSDAGFRSKLKTFLGSKSLSGRVTPVDVVDYPEFFASATIEGTLYKLPDFVLDTPSLLQVLVKNQKDRIFQSDADAIKFSRDKSGNVVSATLQRENSSITISAQRFLFSAGKGNQKLIESAELKTPKCQLRPLNMVYLKSASLPPVYVHCIGDNFSLTPKLTITSHSDDEGNVVWYLGGELAESGVGKSPDTQISSAKSLLRELFPWVDIEDAQFSCLPIERAEANINNNYRPEDAYFIEESNVLAAWPTKLTLAPNLADKVVEHLLQEKVEKHSRDDEHELNAVLQPAKLASAHWE